jgi:hypothetical protein
MEHLILEYLLNIFIISQDKISLLKFFGWVMFKIKVLIVEYLVLEYLLNIIISGDKILLVEFFDLVVIYKFSS